MKGPLGSLIGPSADTASWSNDQTATIPQNDPPEKAGKRRWSGNSGMIVNQNAGSNLDRGTGQASTTLALSKHGEEVVDGSVDNDKGPEAERTAWQ